MVGDATKTPRRGNLSKTDLKSLGNGTYEGRRTFEIDDLSVKATEEGTYIFGYANTKGKPDAYGDIPTSLNGKPVYDLSRFKKNPVALVDHYNSVGAIFGAFIFGGDDGTMEDDKGLRIKLRLMDNPQTDMTRHAVEAYKTGFARAFSIGGRWAYEDKENPAFLTKASIWEISGVGIPADADALSRVSRVKAAPGSPVDEVAKVKLEVMEALARKFAETGDLSLLKKIELLRRTK